MSAHYIKKPIFLISVVIGGSIGLVSMLAWIAMRPINQRNGFNRSFITPTVMIENVMQKEVVIDIAGSTQHHFFFKTKDPSILLSTNIRLQDKKYIRLNIPKNKKLLSATYTFVDSPYVNILVGQIPAVIKYKIYDSIFFFYQFPNSIFTRGIMVGPNSYIFRGFDTTVKTADQIFLKGNPLLGMIQREDNISDRSKDGGISTDGALCYDSKTNFLVYTFFYRNQFLCMDTNLNLLYKGNTIDTISNSSIKSDANENILTAITPKRMTNAACAVSNGLLFIRSKIKGDNETSDEFRNNSPIDIYDIETGNYRGSFYIPEYKNEKVNRFRIFDNKIIAFYESSIVSYSTTLAIVK